MALIGDANSVRTSYLAGSSAKTTTAQYMAGYISAEGTVSVCNTTTAKCIGIIDSFQSASSETISVITHGIAKGYANASIAAGAAVTAVDGGKLAAFGGTYTSIITTPILGRAESAASTNGAITIYVDPLTIS